MRRAVPSCLLAVALAAGLTVPGPARAAELPGLPRLRAVTGTRPAVVDATGRQVLLRGVNVNQLGDYYQANPDLVPRLDLAEADFAHMASLGFNVVRLILSWSRLEPARGVFDQGYLDQIREVVGWARAHGIYVVLDMHQDAWGKYIATPPGETCVPPFEPAIGWDGAPEWATMTDGAPTCRFALREVSPAVAHAFTSFYADRAGIQTELLRTWAWLARAFAADPTVAGYDLLNEPHPGYTAVGPADLALLGAFYGRAVAAIRKAERSVPGGFSHIVFFEPMASFSATSVSVSPHPGFTTDPNIVFAPHLYAESLTADGAVPGPPVVTIETGFAEAKRESARYRSTFWSGEWGWFGDPATSGDEVARYGAMEDTYRVGGAWWVWKQPCGDPHNIGVPNGQPGEISPSLVRIACPEDVQVGIPDEFGRVLTRAFPRAAPGRITALAADPGPGTLELSGLTAVPGVLDVWLPERAGSGPPVVTSGSRVTGIELVPVPGGWRLLGTATGPYQLTVGRSPG